MFAEAYVQSVAAAADKNAKKTIINQLPDQARLALIRGSTVRTSIEPRAVVPTCAQLVEASSRNAASSALQFLMGKTKGRAQYSPTHLEGICTKSIFWGDFGVPEFLTIFAVFPKSKLTIAMKNFVIDHENRKIHGSKPSDANLEYMKKLYLFIPKHLLDTTWAFQTYCLLLEIIFGNTSLIYREVKNVWFFVKNNDSAFE
jgi:hypothetical protein